MSSARFRWWVLLAVGVSSLSGGVMAVAFTPLIGDVSKGLGVDLGTATFGILGLTTFVTSLAIGIVGFVVDRLGVFSVMIGGQILLFLATAAMPLAGDNYTAVLLLRLLQGLGGASLTATITPALAQWFDDHDIGRAMGLQAIGIPLGFVVGMNVAPLMSHLFGSWRWGIAVLALAPMLALLITLPVAASAKKHAPVMAPDGGQPVFAGILSFARLTTFWIGLATVVLCFGSGFTASNLTPGFLAVAYPAGAGYGAQAAGAIMLVSALGGAVGPPLGGLLLDKVFAGNARSVVTLAWVLTSICYIGIVFPSVYANHVVLMLDLLVSGLTGPFINVTMMSYAAKAFPREAVGRIAGLWLAVGSLAGSAGVMGGGLALHLTGNYRLAFFMIGGVSFIGIALAPFLRAPTEEKTPEASSSGSPLHPISQRPPETLASELCSELQLPPVSESEM